ncbi:aromatic prenyltransferase [Aspergillus karnatakaensis]|uniref:aromatic prenyltransferase n=1 Tax=Aspergillus karnatakaensis TaxID=1810916 RepID=UPI003CCCA2A4
MSLAVAKNMFTLGGRLVNEDTPKALDALEDLWRLSLGISGDVLEGEEVPPRDEKSEGHRTGGVIFNYEIKPGSVVPKAQMYIPVRHYAQNDMAIAEGVAAFFKKQGWQSHAESYVDSIRDILSVTPAGRKKGY